MAKARVDVTVDGSKVKSGLAEMRKDFREFAGEITESAARAGEFIGIALGAEMFRSTIEGYDRVAKMAEKFGESAETIQRVTMAAKMGGMEMENFGMMMSKLEKNIETQAAGGKDLTKVWTLMGVSASEFAQLNMEDKVLALSKGFDEAEKSGEGTYAMTQLLGRSGAEMIPLLQKGHEEIKKIFDDTVTASQSDVDRMEEINDELDQILNTAKVGTVKLVQAIIIIFESLGLGLHEMQTDMIGVFVAVTGAGKDFYAHMQEQSDVWGKKVSDNMRLISGDDDATKAEDRAAKRKAAKAALAATLDNPEDVKGEKAEERKAAEEKRKWDEKEAKDIRDAAKTKRDAAKEANDAAIEGESDPVKKRQMQREALKREEEQALADLADAARRGDVLYNDYYAKKEEITQKYNLGISKVNKDASDAEIKEADAIGKTKLDTLKTDFETAATLETDATKKRVIQREAIKAEMDAELHDLKTQLDNKKITQAEYEASVTNIKAKAKNENGKLDAELRGEFRPLDFSVDSFRARGGAGGHAGLGTGGNMSPELAQLIKTATASEQSLVQLKQIHDKMKKGKKFQ